MPGTQRENKVIECLAAVAWEPNKPITVETVQVAPPKAGEVRIKAERTGICYSDIAMMTGKFPNLKFPCILGHECAAIVESVGENVTNVERGDFILTLWNSQCGDCDDCLDSEGRCRDTTYNSQVQESGIKCRGQTLYKMGPLAGFSEYSVVPKNCVIKIDSRAPIEKISPFSCSVPTGYQAAKTIAKVRKFSTVVIYGLGVVGMSVALACRDQQARRIIGVDTRTFKFQTAKIFGCTDFINPDASDKPVEELVREMTGGGADYAFVCFRGKPEAESAIEASLTGSGQTIIVGCDNDKIETSFFNFFAGKSITGTWCGAHRNLTEVKDLINRYLSGKLIETDYLTTHTITLDKINEGLSIKNSGNSIRTAIIF